MVSTFCSFAVRERKRKSCVQLFGISRVDIERVDYVVSIFIFVIAGCTIEVFTLPHRVIFMYIYVFLCCYYYPVNAFVPVSSSVKSIFVRNSSAYYLLDMKCVIKQISKVYYYNTTIIALA